MAHGAAQYLRMSTDQQTLSIEIQKEAIRVYAEARGLEIVQTYADPARSGVRLAGRDGMQQLLKDVMNPTRPFDTVLVLDVTRWGRFQDVDESAYYEHHCRRHGVAVVYVGEPFISNGRPFDSLVKQLKRSMAAEFSRELGVKSRAGQERAVHLGFATGTLPCIGYRRQAIAAGGAAKGVLSVRERKPVKTDRVRWVLGPDDEVEAVRWAFDQFAWHGTACTRIARELQRRGITSNRGVAITEFQIRRLLSNEIVRGNFVWGRRGVQQAITDIPCLPHSLRVNNMLPAVVDLKTWERTQDLLAQSVIRRHAGTSREILLRRLREVLVANPDLHGAQFKRYGLPALGVFRRHFGSLSGAYAAAHRAPDNEVLPRALSFPATQWISKKFLCDVAALARASGANVAIDIRRNVLRVGSAAIKVRVARRTIPEESRPWRVSHLEGRAEGQFLLVMRLEDNRVAGRDFYLLPPEEHAAFTGTLNTRVLSRFARFRVADQSDLALRLSHLSENQDELRWSA